MDSLLKNKPALPLQPTTLRPPLNGLTPGLFSAFICLCLGLLTVLCLLYTSHQGGPPVVNYRGPIPTNHSKPAFNATTIPTQPSTGPPTPKQAQVISQVYTPNQRFASALSHFSNASIQKLHILSQSTADPAYNSPEKLLQYPAGAWEFSFELDKTTGTFSYQEAMDGEQLSLLKKSGVLMSDDGKGWHRVKASRFSQPPYSFSRVKSLEELPFLFLDPPSPVGLKGTPEVVGMAGCDIVRMTPTKPVKGSTEAPGPEKPKEILFWITTGDQPSLKAARYFWISNPPGGTVYTVSQVNFQ